MTSSRGEGAPFHGSGAGERDLATLLRAMQPVVDDVAYLFCSVPPELLASLLPNVRGLFHESEGVTVIVDRCEAERLGIAAGGEWARITLTIHSALDAVGLLARVTAALAEAGISVNAVSAFYHDHLFVPWAERDRAMSVLQALSGGEARAEGRRLQG